MTAAIAARAAALVRSRGKSVIFRKVVSSGGPNPVLTTTDYPVKAWITRYAGQELTGTTVTIADLKVILAARAEDGRDLPLPTPRDRILIDGVIRSIIIVLPRSSGSRIGVYDVQAR